MLKRKLKKLFILTSMILLISFLLIKSFSNDIVVAEFSSESDLNKQNEEIKTNFLNDSTNHLIWFIQVVKSSIFLKNLSIYSGKNV
jgi:hypothetical protein